MHRFTYFCPDTSVNCSRLFNHQSAGIKRAASHAKAFPFWVLWKNNLMRKRCSSSNFDLNEGGKKQTKTKHQFLIRAVLFRDFLNGDAYLVAQVPPSVHHAIRAFTQNHLITILIGLINVLMEMEEMCFLRENLRKYSKNEEYTTLEYSDFTHCKQHIYIYTQIFIYICLKYIF